MTTTIIQCQFGIMILTPTVKCPVLLSFKTEEQQYSDYDIKGSNNAGTSGSIFKYRLTFRTKIYRLWPQMSMKQHHTDTAGIVGNRREMWQSQLANKSLERVHMHYSIPIRAKKVLIRFDSRYRIDFFDSIRFGNLINLPLLHWYSNNNDGEFGEGPGGVFLCCGSFCAISISIRQFPTS